MVNVFAWLEKQEQLAASPVVLYGHSLGGLIALTHKDLANRVIARVVFAPVTRPVHNFRILFWDRSCGRTRLRAKKLLIFTGVDSA